MLSKTKYKIIELEKWDEGNPNFVAIHPEVDLLVQLCCLQIATFRLF